MSVLVRRATMQDAGDIARVNTLGWQQGYAGLLPSTYLAAHVVDPAVWSARLENPLPRSAIFVAEVGEQTVGFSGVGPALEAADPEETELGQLYTLYVLAQHHGTGIGYRLHREGLAALAAAGFSRALLWVLATNARAIAFYQRQGWLPVSQWQDDVLDGLVIREQRFHRDLAQS